MVSLTVIRMIPVAIAVAGQGLRPGAIAFMGWFVRTAAWLGLRLVRLRRGRVL